MRILILLLTLYIFNITPAFGENVYPSSNDPNGLKVEVDSLKMQIDKLNSQLNSLHHEMTYQKMLTQVISIINETNILKNSIDIFNNELLIFGIHNQIKKRHKKVFQTTIDNFNEAAKLKEEDLKNWELLFDILNNVDFFTEEEIYLLKNRASAVLVNLFMITSSINSATSKLDLK